LRSVLTAEYALIQSYVKHAFPKAIIKVIALK
jgi:hypothetical protein